MTSQANQPMQTDVGFGDTADHPNRWIGAAQGVQAP
jgi:hypothetical protein